MAKNDADFYEAGFTTLVLTLSSSAWVGLGKIADPISGETKKDFPGAKFAIDTLVMLREKTRGNLTPDEEKILNNTVAELQANYAETVFARKKESEERPSEKNTAPPENGANKSDKDENQQEQES
jgi:hypothetical protein